MPPERLLFVSFFVIQIIHVIHSVGCLLTKIHCPITINADIVNTSLKKYKKSRMYKYTIRIKRHYEQENEVLAGLWKIRIIMGNFSAKCRLDIL